MCADFSFTRVDVARSFVREVRDALIGTRTLRIRSVGFRITSCFSHIQRSMVANPKNIRYKHCV